MVDENIAESCQTDGTAEETYEPSLDHDFSTENRKRYSAALKYVNDFHRTISNKLNELNAEEEPNIFKIPEIPDYAWWYTILSKSQNKQKPEKDYCNHNKSIVSASTPIFSEEKHERRRSNPRSEGNIKQVSKYQETTTRRKFLPRDMNDSLDYSDAENEAVSAKPDDEAKQMKNESSKTGYILDLIKDRLLEEFLQDFRCSRKPQKETRLVKSCFSVVNIQPRISLLDYAYKKYARSDKCEDIIISPTTPRKVKQMFDVISRENFTSTNIFENAAFKQDLDLSDSDSVILDDEEFERMSQKSPCLEDHPESFSHPERSNPLKLTGKDMTMLDEKMLSTIGLFTERGDVRPGVIDILEEQKKLKSNDSRNKQFRGKRQWDIQIHLKPKSGLGSSLPSVSSDKSFMSLASDIKLQVQNVESFESNK